MLGVAAGVGVKGLAAGSVSSLILTPASSAEVDAVDSLVAGVARLTRASTGDARGTKLRSTSAGSTTHAAAMAPMTAAMADTVTARNCHLRGNGL